MPYRVKRGEAVLHAIERIAMEQIGRAQGELCGREADVAEAVHQARKRFKKLRALLRLVRPVLGSKTFKAENRYFRDRGRELASARDDQVMLDTLEALADVHADAGIPEELAGLHGLLVERRDAHLHLEGDGKDLGARMAEVADSLGRYPERLADWHIGAEGFDALGPGLTRSYRDGRKALRRVRKAPDDARFHEWRKRVKDHWYHSRLLRGLWSGPMDARIAELKRLSDLLGDDHDLAVLKGTVEEVAGENLSSRAKKRLLRKVFRRQARLREEALVLGRRAYAEKPKRLRERWDAYWEAWREA